MKQANTSVAKIVDILPGAIGVAGWLFVASVLPTQAQTWSTPNLGGYMGFGASSAPATYNAGFSQYVAMLGRSQYAYYASDFSAGLAPGTWMNGQNTSANCYYDIEGGAGAGGGYGNEWCNNGFGMGVVGPNFAGVANGTSAGWGQDGLYAVAQISPRLLYPPTVEMFRGGTCGQFAGYGYLALPLLPGKATTAGFNVPTGNHWWTLFFNTRNFQGPVATVVPYFWSQFTTNNPGWAGQLLDSLWAEPNKQISSESHTVPGKEYDGPEGSFLRVEPMFVAINSGTNGTIALNSPTVYNQSALWNAAQQWFTNNGAAPAGPFTSGANVQTVGGVGLGWEVWSSPLHTNSGGMPMNLSYMTSYQPDSETAGYRWGTNQVTFTQFASGTNAVVMPEWYQLVTNLDQYGNWVGTWTPVPAAAVPAAAQLASVSFDSGGPPPLPGSWTAPSDSVWTSPGPQAGPFQVRLDDGKLVTYSWYRFEDQPAIMSAGLTQAERDQLQAEVVKIHGAWTNGGSYLAAPTMGILAEIDAALLVTPPPGMETGYVPIATSQVWGGWVTNTWKQATSGNWSVATNWASTNVPAAGGHSYYWVNFSGSGSYVATNDLGGGYGYGGYAVNQLNFAGPVTLTGNPITLTTDYGSLPQINQNSANAVVINTPLKLDVSTVLGGTGSGLVIISNVISGPWHSLTINSPGTWRLCGLSNNTYSGGTIINSGTVIWGATTNGTSPDCSYALGSGPVTLNSGATLQFEHASPANALTLNGGTLYATNSAGVTWQGPVTINTNSTVRTDYGMEISGNVSGAGGFTKRGTNTLTLSGVNSYAGATLVQTGTLACATSASLGAGALSVSNGAVVNLSYTGSRTIYSLTLGGTNKLAGVYGSSNSPATYPDAHFSGTGTGTVTVPVPVSLVDLPATGVATNQATLNANLGLSLAYGGTNAGVLAYWGTANGGTNPAAWAKSAYVGKWSNIASKDISSTVSALAANTTYYFTFLATNAAYSVWATNVLSFTTPQPPTALAFASVPLNPAAGYPFSVTVQAQDANGKPQNVTRDTAVLLSRSSGSGTLSGTLSGTITSGSSNVVISGVVYSVAETMTLAATATAGMSLTAAASLPITFIPLTVTGTLGCSSTTVNGSVIITFTNGSGTWTPPAGITNVEVLVVGGGGGGGADGGGGGGAGGVIHTNGFKVSGAVTVTLGGGGAGGVYGSAASASGTDSVFSTLTAKGGGRGAGYGTTAHAAGSGGSGGGGSFNNTAGGSGTAGQGKNGGSESGSYDGAGGGGAGAVGAANNGLIGGNGGVGVQYSITGSAQWYGGGGGGGTDANDGGVLGGAGGSGGGGQGASSGAALAGAANTGGGGGGGYHLNASSSNKNGAAGGSGVVIVSLSIPALTVDNSAGATNLSAGVAQLRGTLSNGPADVRVYWGTADGGPSAAGWANSVLLTNRAAGSFAANVSNLLYGATYYYRCYASNTNSAAWAPATASFMTMRPATPCSLTNTSATTITSSSAALNATLACTGAVYDVVAYWHTTNGGTNAAAWANSAYVGSWTNVVSTSLAYTAGGLLSNTPYYFTFCATNPLDVLWATNVLSFTTLPPPGPTVDNAAGAANLAAGVAQLRGTLSNGLADVRFYWGAADGGTTPAAWANSALVAGAGNGSVSVNASNLLYGLTYYYRCQASNQWGAAWSPATASFTTLKPVATTVAQIPYSNMVEVSASSQYGGYPAANAFNGAGLQANDTHTTSGNWFSSGTAAVTNEWLKVRFDQPYALDHLRVWAFNSGSVTPGVTNADVYVLNSATDPAGNVNLGGGPFKTNGWSLLLARQYFAPSASATTETNTDPSISLGGVTAQQLALKINAVVSGTYAGFAEVQIYQLASALSLMNSAASAVTATAAGLNATLGCTGAVYQVYAYWNTVNGGTNGGLWTNSAYVGSWTNLGSASLSYTAMGLAPATPYYFTFCATNAVDTLWAANVQSFTTLTPPPAPVVDNGAGATNLAVGVAQLRGTLANGPADARLYWGTSDGGTNFGLWTSGFGLPSVGSGGFASNVSNLLYGLTYYYRTYASNQWGIAWAPATTNFTTLRPNSTLANSAATGLATDAAALHATLACTGAVYQVTAFWNTADGGTNAALWTNSASVGACTNVVSTNLSFAVANLLPNTAYYFTFRATNALDSLWAANVQSFTTLSPPGPVVDNGAGATNLAVGVAQLRGTLANGPADVRLYWGTSDGGANFGLWTSGFGLPSVASGGFASNVSNLLYGLTYYYRSYASNQWGTAWAPATSNFTTLRPNSTLANSPASGLATNAAALNATLACTGAVYQVTAFWNTADGGTNAALWPNSASVGACTNVVSTNLSFAVANLLPNTAYYFTFRATNALDSLWAANVQSFTTLSPPGPVVDNGAGATNLAVGVAQLRGTLANGPADVRLYWGASDGGANSGLWTSGFGLPSVASGGFASNVSNLLYGLTYYYRTYASNQWGSAWAPATTNFTTLRPNSTLANSAATGLATNAAALNATLACTGAVYQVTAFWNTADGGTNAALWPYSAYVGAWTNAAATSLSLQVAGLMPQTQYYFTFLATNALDSLWATNVGSFTTLAVGPPQPVLPLNGVTVTNGVPCFSFTASAGCMYRLDYKNLLTDAGWSYGDWSTNATGGDLPMTLTDTSAAGQAQRFYRLEAAYP